MNNTDRVADIQLSDWAGSANKLSVIDDGTKARFGIDINRNGVRVSLGVDVDFADLDQVRDMLDTIIGRNAAQER